MLKKFFLLLLCSLALHAGFLEKESAEALKAKKLILINIESDDCPYCKKMRKEVFDNPANRSKIDAKYLVVTFKNSDPSLPRDLQPRYVPANAIYSPTKKDIVDAYAGYMEAKSFMDMLEETYKEEFKK